MGRGEWKAILPGGGSKCEEEALGQLWGRRAQMGVGRAGKVKGKLLSRVLLCDPAGSYSL